MDEQRVAGDLHAPIIGMQRSARPRPEEREEEQYETKLAALRAAIDEGDASGIAEGDVFGRVRKALKLPVSPR